ncbi:hypothetical protein AAF712_011978 [Marasmius tenuissimus]|uniref:Apple domain-containing protein n=1 Tax=Marasmius tenuissimus TaxID=585030 RepID=A0ABR2ZJ31_9AGAR
MRFASLFVVAVTAVAAVSATFLPFKLFKGNHWGAPIPPWQIGCRPGWYFGDHFDGIEGHGIPWLKDQFHCKLFGLLSWDYLRCPGPYHPPSHPPSPPHGGGDDGYYHKVFSGLDGAIQADDYLTFGLVDTIEDCKAMCEQVNGCNFINTYYDVHGKGGSHLLTCALFEGCHSRAEATNKGGQRQPDGSLNFIKESAGFCKGGY